jgi:hypothetical protein
MAVLRRPRRRARVVLRTERLDEADVGGDDDKPLFFFVGPLVAGSDSCYASQPLLDSGFVAGVAQR